MSPRDRELLTGMGNCYEACGADFKGTVEMVASARNRTADDVLAALIRLRSEFAGSPEYEELRRRLPDGFPM